MTQSPNFIQPLSECRDTLLVGGKAANLGRLIRAGFMVPDGFVVTTIACITAHSQSTKADGRRNIPPEIQEAICLAYRMMGGGIVAVRSSATTEDAANASMAGQYQTLLNVDGEARLLNAVQQCWEGLDSSHSRAYLQEHAIDRSCLAMAVVVQRQVHADVAGVMFTANPRPGGKGQMLIEASWGLGEAIVAGLVQPDMLCLEYKTGRVISAEIADKHTHVPSGSGAEQPVDQLRRRLPCLGENNVHRLWQLGRQVAELYGSPQDIEWAIHEDKLFLLQSRPITTLESADAGLRLLDAARRNLGQKLAAGAGPWVIHNLAETLPHPTPLTWSVVRYLMSGRGGMGAMYRQAGFEPSKAVLDEGFLELIAGRIYMDVSLAPLMLLEDYPFAYDMNLLKFTPEASQAPPTLPRGSIWKTMRAVRRISAANAKLAAMAADFDTRIRQNLFGRISSYVAESRKIDLRKMSTHQLAELWQEHRAQVLDKFAPDLLMPALLCGTAMDELRKFLADRFWDQDADMLAQLITSAGPQDRTMLSLAELYEMGKGTRLPETWLADHGHRTSGEMDLAEPRHREQPEAIKKTAASLASEEDPREKRRRHHDSVLERIETLHARLDADGCRELDRLVDLAGRYAAFREDCKDFMMLGYDLLRDIAREIGRRLKIDDDVFFLSEQEMLNSLDAGFASQNFVRQQKLSYEAEETLRLPRIIDNKSVDELGKASPPPASCGGYRAFSVSAGQAAGPVQIVRSPADTPDIPHGSILVAASTDPSWTSLFARAAGLVLERGGSLSHGAIVAREMGLPAVVLPDATNLFHNGEEIRVDGDHGWVSRTAEQSAGQSSSKIDPADVNVPTNLAPPPPGRKGRLAAKISGLCAAAWGAFIAAMFLLPDIYLYRPALSIVDALLWPLVSALGKPLTVAIVAAAVAAISIIMQRLMTDNRRLLEAKRRAAALSKQARSLTDDSPRRAVLARLAAPVSFRILAAAMIPIGFLLGPMVMPLIWFEERIDPAANNAPAGTPVQIVAMINGDWDQPVSLTVPAEMKINEATPAIRKLPPIRNTLQRLLNSLRQPTAAISQPWETQLAADLFRQQTADDLQAYLDGGIPPQGVTWHIQSPQAWHGKFTAVVSTAGAKQETISVILGDDYPPDSRIATGRAGSPIRELRVSYSQPNGESVFWLPLAFLKGNTQIPLAAWLADFNIGWTMLYILAYLAMLILVRTIVKVA